jgi:class 3 adenylate cyclase
MALSDDLRTEVEAIFREQWTARDGTKVPESEDLKLSNDAVKLDATVLYADLASSTQLVESRARTFAAEVYKAFLHCTAKIIRAEGGTITAYDGDRIMAVFIGDGKETTAARTALKINDARVKIINPAMKKQYTNTDYELRHVVGVDTSDLFIARTGIRGSNDLVWVGRAANYAAKLCTLTPDYPSWITATVYNSLDDSAKYSDGKNMWEARSWTAMNNTTIYRSNWRWSV